VEGVILGRFWRARHRGVRPMRRCSTFALRKASLFRGASGAAVFPGGFGTLDELGDLLALKQNRFTRMPIVVVNIAGYFDALLAWAVHAGREGFLYGGRLLEVASSPAAAVRLLR
ncbi:MAG TPA: LOG family protein, partial [Planctomycetota bacterium]|nr:LOG family protein [Planctomycetota bacterium]